MIVHVHQYDSEGNLTFEADLEYIETYMAYTQFGFETEGVWTEIRIPTAAE